MRKKDVRENISYGLEEKAFLRDLSSAKPWAHWFSMLPTAIALPLTPPPLPGSTNDIGISDNLANIVSTCVRKTIELLSTSFL